MYWVNLRRLEIFSAILQIVFAIGTVTASLWLANIFHFDWLTSFLNIILFIVLNTLLAFGIYVGSCKVLKLPVVCPYGYFFLD